MMAELLTDLIHYQSRQKYINNLTIYNIDIDSSNMVILCIGKDKLQIVIMFVKVYVTLGKIPDFQAA